MKLELSLEILRKLQYIVFTLAAGVALSLVGGIVTAVQEHRATQQLIESTPRIPAPAVLDSR